MSGDNGNNDGKLVAAGLGIAVSAVIAGGLLYSVNKSGVNKNESLQLHIIPAPRRFGNAVAASNPTSLQAGSVGNILQATITNTSVYTGSTVLAPYTFKLHASIGDLNVNDAI
ncbi:MAG: hypothetical protein KKB38_20880, partial [Gammaproteobacteria bacterium]|nr:hypothetical protein [Gammaproteobacteria bacterium]